MPGLRIYPTANHANQRLFVFFRMQPMQIEIKAKAGGLLRIL
jgi:hypothetical protein